MTKTTESSDRHGGAREGAGRPRVPRKENRVKMNRYVIRNRLVTL